MKEVKVLCEKGIEHLARITDAISMVNSAQNYFALTLDAGSIELDDKGSAVAADEVRLIIREKYPDSKIICVISSPFDDNWFSHPFRECDIITVADWEDVFAPPSLKAYLIHHFAEALLSFEGDLSKSMHIKHAHEPPQGCISDFTGNKVDIKLSMLAGNLCLDCEGILLRYGVTPLAIDALRRIFTIVRDESIGKPKQVEPNSAFVIMRFTKNDENDNAYKYGVRPGLIDAGLDVKRADDKVESNQILEKIFRLLQHSRFVIAKIDTNNLNVYFELGTAMGLDKDVLLISEESLVLNLPSDLRNWECLTYEKGNYEQLRERIAQFYKDNYGLPKLG